jgi:HAMP domain-containing protein
MNDKPKELEEHSAHIFEMGCMEQRVYLKNDADAVIEAKDAKIAELKQQYNDMDIAHTVHIAKMNAKIEELESNERRLKRALWLSRADRAMMTLDYFTLKCRWFKDYMKVEPPKCDVKMIHKWATVQRKCRAKMEEYK